MLNKEKLTKYVWFQEKLWKVNSKLSPTPFDDYLLLSRKDKDQIHMDNKTHPVRLVLVDVHNQEVYPDVPEIRSYMDKMKNLNEKRDKIKANIGKYWYGDEGFIVQQYYADFIDHEEEE